MTDKWIIRTWKRATSTDETCWAWESDDGDHNGGGFTIETELFRHVAQSFRRFHACSAVKVTPLGGNWYRIEAHEDNRKENHGRDHR